MPVPNTNIILNGILGVEALLNNPKFTWKGESFNCVPNTLDDKEQAAEAGFTENTNFRMTVRLNQFTPNVYPQLNDYIVYLGYTLLIKEVRKPAHGVFWVYICELPATK